MTYVFEVIVPLTQSSIENITGALIDDKDYEILGAELKTVSINKTLYEVELDRLVPYIQEGLGKLNGEISYEEIFFLEEHLTKAYDSVPVSLLTPLTSLIEEIPTLLMAAALEGSTLRFIEVETK